MRLVLALLTSAALVALAAPVATAGGSAPANGASYRPDGQISKDCSNIPEWQACNPALAGDNVYNATGKKQKRSHIDYLTYSTERDPRAVVFRISIQNEGSVADRFRIDADGVTAGYVVKFLRKTTNITSAVEAGTYTTPVLAPGASFVIKAKVVMPCDSWDYCGQDRAVRLVTIRSVADPSALDAVKFVRRVWECTC